jgi:hypothetical protein
LAAESACRVRVERALLLDQRGKQVQDQGVNVRPQFGDEKGHLVSDQPRDKMHIAAEAVLLGHRDMAPEFLCAYPYVC